MLPIPLKRPVKTDVKRPLMHYLYKEREKRMTLGDKLQKFNIFSSQTTVDDATASMNSAFSSLHDLRKEITAISDQTSIPTVVHYRTVLKYFAQLNFIQGRFPLSRDEVRIDFHWCDAFATDIHVKIPVLLWEKVSVLWNMAALQNNIGASLDHTREEGAKAAASHCSLAAGIFAYIQQLSNDFKEERTRDISPQLLNLMREVCLANAQNCVYDGARVKGMKDATLARVALATSQSFQTCFEYARVTHAREDWIRVLEVNINSFHAAAQYWQSKVDHDNAVKTRKDWGIECGRLAYAETLINRALGLNQQLVEFTSKSRTLALLELRDKIATAKNEADTKNRGIYFCIEPTPDQLAPISPLALAKVKPFDPSKEMEGTVDYFADFVPQVVASAIEEFTGKVSTLVEGAKEEAQTASDTMRATLASLGLPASLQASNTDAGLPDSVWVEITSVQAKGGGAALEAGLRANQENNREFMQLLDEATRKLSSDASEELKRRQQYGAKWTRATDTAEVGTLRREIEKYQTLLQDAAASDNQVRSKLVQHQDDIAQLGCTRQQLDGIMPRVDDIASMSQQERQEVENLVVETSSILESRDSDVAELDKIAPTLDIKQPLLRDSARKVSSGGIFEIDDKEALFEKTMAPLSSIVGRIHESVQTQPALLERLAAANTAFDAKQQSNPVLSRRSQILSGLQQGVSSFKEVEANISQGRKFYEQFRDRVHELSARVQDYLRVRDLEAREHIAAIERPSIPSPVPARSPMPSQSPAPAPAGQQAFGRVAAPPPAYAPPPSYGAASSSSGYGSSAPAARAVALPGYNSNTSAPAPSGYVRAAPVVATTVRATPVTTVRATPVPAAHVRATPVRATPVSGASSSSSSGASWTCKMCTFINQKPNALACEMCNSMRE